MESFLVSISTVSIAEIGDRTQLLSLMLAAHYRRPWPILAGVLCATVAARTRSCFIKSSAAGMQSLRERPTQPREGIKPSTSSLH
jgi:putative Ca2+/H+ antiporter (TMEM165/GDT1 family)